MTFPPATLPDRDDPGNENDGDLGGEEHLPLSDVNRLGDSCPDVGEPGGEETSSSTEEKNR